MCLYTCETAGYATVENKAQRLTSPPPPPWKLNVFFCVETLHFRLFQISKSLNYFAK